MTNLVRITLSIGAAALFAGCSGSQPPIVTSGVVQERGGDRVLPPSSSFHFVYRFRNSGAGDFPNTSLINVNGILYGTTWNGGGFGLGNIFLVTTYGQEEDPYAFSGHGDGEGPTALILVNGTIYGVDSEYGKYYGGVFFKMNSSVSHYLTVLHSFGNYGDGGGALSLIHVKGIFYGTTSWGGGGSCSSGCGTVFRTTANGDEKVLYSFQGGADGANPFGSLIDVNHTLYGTTRYGGSSGNGTVFAVTTSGAEHILYSFSGGADGATPMAGLVNVKGTLYGTTSAGGGTGCTYNNNPGCGTVFSITTSGQETVLYRFAGGSDGAFPRAPLIALKGTLYGTTFAGGNSGCYGHGCGTVYGISTAGTEKVLHIFGSGKLAARNPVAGLLDMGGTLYGTTSAGGGARRNGGYGTVFAISP